MFKNAAIAAAAFAAACTTGAAHAAVVDFEELSSDTIYDSPLVSGGLVFSNDGAGGGVDGFVAIPYFGIPSSNGSITLVANYFGSVTTVTAVGGVPFTLTSFDFSDAFGYADDPLQIDFTFTTQSAELGATYFVDFLSGMQTQLVGISGILSFSFVVSGSDFGEDTIQTDNWVYTLDAAPAVPEPASWAMMIGGMALTGAAMRRRTMKIAFAA